MLLHLGDITAFLESKTATTKVIKGPSVYNIADKSTTEELEPKQEAEETQYKGPPRQIR